LVGDELGVVDAGRGVFRNQVRVPQPRAGHERNQIIDSARFDVRSANGRHMLPARVLEDGVAQGTDSCVVVDVM
jgi:hypothetical protein